MRKKSAMKTLADWTDLEVDSYMSRFVLTGTIPNKEPLLKEISEEIELAARCKMDYTPLERVYTWVIGYQPPTPAPMVGLELESRVAS